MKTIFHCPWIAVIILFATLPAQAFGEDKSPDQLRADAAKLVAKAQDLKTDGQSEEANKLARQAEELQQAAKSIEKQSRLKRAEENEDLTKAKDEVEELRARWKELEAAGKMDEAAMVKRRLADLEKRPAPEKTQRKLKQAEKELEAAQIESEQRKSTNHQPEDKVERRIKREVIERRVKERDDEDWRESSEPAPADREGRIQHVVAAIENLRAAGMIEPADRLERALERMKRQVREENVSPTPKRPGPRTEFTPQEELVRPERPGRAGGGMPPAGPAKRFRGTEPFDPGQSNPPQGFHPQDQAEFRAQVSELQAEVRELRRSLKELRGVLEERTNERR